MCGIAGFQARTGGTLPDVADTLIQRLGHRGPDGNGRFQQDGLLLVHTRLAIIDVAGGQQPFVHQPLAVVANGEIYNDRELRQDFPDHPYQSHSDCENIIPLYNKYYTEFAKYLRGMYAIAIADTGRRQLILSRDPFGIKPLYYAITPHGVLFASEPQAMLDNANVSRETSGEKVSEIFHLQFTTGRQTIFRDIQRVLPGETLVFQNGALIGTHHTPALPEPPFGRTNEAEALERLDHLLRDSVAVHERSDVPFGVFLSGGIDSATVTRLVQQRPLVAYTAWFPETGAHDEREQARATAQAMGLEHHEIPVTRDWFNASLPRIVAAQDDPVTDYALIPTHALAEAASRELRVVLTGEGGDEAFAGYGRYRKGMRPWPFRKTAKPRSSFRAHLDILRPEMRAFDPTLPATPKGYDRLQRLQAFDWGDPLAHGLLAKVDRALMRYGVEGRVPFLDLPLARFGLSLPPHLKLRNRRGKWILRQYLRSILPSGNAFAKKRGFTVPVGDWIAADAATLGPLVAQQAGIRQFCNPPAVIRLFEGERSGDVDMLRWKLLFFALWHQHHICRVDAGGGIQEVLQ